MRQTSRANTLAQYGALEGAGRRLAMARAGLVPPAVAAPGLAWPGLAWPGGAVSPDPGAHLASLASSELGAVAPLPSPRSRWLLQPGHLSPEGGCQQGANLGIACVSSWVLARRPICSRGGARSGPILVEGPERGLVLSSQSPTHPTLTHQVSHGRARTSILRFVCWSLACGG